jgi:hypothetical protein
MRQAIRTIGIVVQMTVALWAAEGSAADQSSVGLPEVNVTAPPITPQYKKCGSKKINGLLFRAPDRGSPPRLPEHARPGRK